VGPPPDSVDADLLGRRVVEVLREVEGSMKRGLLKTEQAARLLGVDAERVRANDLPKNAPKASRRRRGSAPSLPATGQAVVDW
jgi:hypothetical protein